MGFCYYFYWVLFPLTESIIICKKATRSASAMQRHGKVNLGEVCPEERRRKVLPVGGRGRGGTCAPLQHPPQPLPCWRGGTHTSLGFLPFFGERSRRKSVVYCIWALKAWEVHFIQCYVWRKLQSLLMHEAKLFKYHCYVNIYICKKKKKNFLVIILSIQCIPSSLNSKY